MFKKTEESEWTRFSKALGGKDQPREREETAEIDEDLLEDDPTIIAPPTPVPPVMQPPQPVMQRSMPATVDLPPMAPPPTRQAPPTLPSLEAEMWEPSAEPAPATPMLDDYESVIGRGTTVEGNFRSETSVRIHGAVQGEIESKGRVIVDDDATVNAKITAQEIAIAGEVNGELHCPGRVEISPSGRVTGEISAGTLIMQEGAFFEGHLKMLNRGGPASAPASE